MGLRKLQFLLQQTPCPPGLSATPTFTLLELYNVSLNTLLINRRQFANILILSTASMRYSGYSTTVLLNLCLSHL